MCVDLRTKFQVSIILLTCFRQGILLPRPPTVKRTPKNPNPIRVKDTHRDKAKSNKTPALRKNPLFIRGS